MSAAAKEYYAVCLVPTRIAFKTNATPEQLTNVAHQACAQLPTEGVYKPRLMEVVEKKDGEPLKTPPIPPLKAA